MPEGQEQQRQALGQFFIPQELEALEEVTGGKDGPQPMLGTLLDPSSPASQHPMGAVRRIPGVGMGVRGAMRSGREEPFPFLFGATPSSTQT